MDSERIACGLPTVTSPPKGQASEYDKKYFLALRFPWLATGNLQSFIETERDKN
jgi:hypothetical protein